MDRLNNRAAPRRLPTSDATQGRGDYRMPLFEDMTAYDPTRPGNSSNTYHLIKAGLEQQGIDAQTWNSMPSDLQWQVVDEILSPTPSPEAAPTPGPSGMPFRPRRFMIDPNRGL